MSNLESEFSLSPQSQAVLARTTEIAARWKRLLFSGLFSDQSVPLLLALTEDPTCIDVLNLCGIKVNTIDRQFLNHKEVIIKRTPEGLIEDISADKTFIEDYEEDDKTTSCTQSILISAQIDANLCKNQPTDQKTTIEPLDILTAIIGRHNCGYAARVLATEGLTLEKLTSVEYDLNIARGVKETANEMIEGINRYLG